MICYFWVISLKKCQCVNGIPWPLDMLIKTQVNEEGKEMMRKCRRRSELEKKKRMNLEIEKIKVEQKEEIERPCTYACMLSLCLIVVQCKGTHCYSLTVLLFECDFESFETFYINGKSSINVTYY